MRTLRLLAASLTVVTALAVAAPVALADGDHGDHGEHGNGQKYQHKQKKDFEDLQGADWAEINIEKAFQLGLMVGEGEGRFNPHAPITREAAVVTAIRLMGLEDQAKTEANADLHFTDANKIDAWAHGAVAVAVEKGILPPAGDGELRAREPASRLWVSVLLVKALGYDAEAQGKMNVHLSFKDTADIPTNLIGYVAAAVDHQLVTGYEDNTFKPNKPVTRAEMAALLGRTDDQLSERGERKGELHGTVQSVDATAGSLTIKGAHGTISASLTADAAIFVNKKAAELSDVQVGMSIWVKLSASMEITFVDARTPDNSGGGGTVGTTLTGTVAAVVQPQGSALGVLSVQPASGPAVTAPVAPLATITGADGAAITLASVHLGDTVGVQVIAGIILSITDTGAAPPPPPPTSTSVTGQVYSMSFVSATGTGSIVIVPDGGGASVTATVYGTTSVTLLNADGSSTARTVADVVAGMQVKATISNNVATAIQIIAPAVGIQGRVMAFTAPTSSTPGTLIFLADGAATATTYSIPATVPVLQGTTVKSFSDLTVNTAIRVVIQGGAVVRIDLL